MLLKANLTRINRVTGWYLKDGYIAKPKRFQHIVYPARHIKLISGYKAYILPKRLGDLKSQLATNALAKLRYIK